MNKIEALRILELSDNSTINQVKHKHENLSRLYKNDRSINLQKINEAYHFLTKHLEYQVEDKGVIQKKTENFWYHNNVFVKIAGVILLLVTIGFIVMALYNNMLKQPHVTILFIGERALSSKEIDNIESYCINNLDFKTTNILSYALVDEKNANNNEVTFEELEKISLELKASFVITDEAIAKILIQENMVTPLFEKELKKLDMYESANNLLYDKYKNNERFPYFIRFKANSTFNIEDNFSYNTIAILNANYWYNDTYRMIKRL